MKKETKIESESNQLKEKLLNEQLTIGNQSMSLVNKEREQKIKCDKIEHARRNVEIVSRVVGSFQDDIKKKMLEVLAINLEILKETSKL